MRVMLIYDKNVMFTTYRREDAIDIEIEASGYMKDMAADCQEGHGEQVSLHSFYFTLYDFSVIM